MDLDEKIESIKDDTKFLKKLIEALQSYARFINFNAQKLPLDLKAIDDLGKFTFYDYMEMMINMSEEERESLKAKQTQ